MDYLAVCMWLIALLKNSEALTSIVGGNIFRNLIPQGVALPAVRINLIVSKATLFSTGERALTRATIQVAACTQGDDLQLPASIFQAIDDAIDNQVCTINGLAAKCNQEMLVDSSQAVDGERFNLLGARYRIIYYQPAGAASPTFMPILQTFNTSGGNMTAVTAAATGNGQSYQFCNLGPGTVTITFTGTDTVAGETELTLEAYGNVIIASYEPGSWSIVSLYQTTLSDVSANENIFDPTGDGPGFDPTADP